MHYVECIVWFVAQLVCQCSAWHVLYQWPELWPQTARYASFDTPGASNTWHVL